MFVFYEVVNIIRIYNVVIYQKTTKINLVDVHLSFIDLHYTKGRNYGSKTKRKMQYIQKASRCLAGLNAL